MSNYKYLLGFVALLFAPQIVQGAFAGFSEYLTSILILALIYMITTLGLSVIFGFVGWVSLAQQAFFGIGAYVSAILVKFWGEPFLVGLISAIIVTVFVAFLLGLPSLKLNPFAFSIVTMAFWLIVQVVAFNWVAVTNGPTGIGLIPRPPIRVFGTAIDISSNYSIFYLCWVFAAVSFAIIYLVIHSRVGRAFISIREDETLAKSLGVNVFKYKMIAFTISALFAGMAGSLYAHFLTTVTPIDIFNVYFVIYQFIIVVVGGPTSLGGIAFASVIFTFIPEALRSAAGLRETVYGVLLIIAILRLPGGIGQGYKRLLKRKNTNDRTRV